MPQQFDEGGNIIAISDQELAQRRQKLTDQYNQQYTNIQSQIQAATDQLNGIQARIDARNEDLQTAYAKSVKDLGGQLNDLIVQIDQKTNQSVGLDKEIADKKEASKAAESNLSAAYVDLDADKIAVANQAAYNAQQKEIQEAWQKDLDSKESQIDQRSKETDVTLSRRSDILDHKESNLIEREETLKESFNSLSDQKLDLENDRQKLVQRESDLEQKIIAAKELLNQAREIKMDLDEIQEKEMSFGQRELQIQKDTNQIRTTQIAQAQKQNELNARQTTIEAAEKRIAGG